MHRRRVVLAVLAASSHALPKDVVSAAAADTCPNVACASSLPSNFCCPKDSQCQALAGDTTALCCPSGSSCERIQPIACDLSLQDPKKHPAAVVFTSVFDVDLPVCANGCCPFGYSCDNKTCVADKDQSKKPLGSSSKTTSAAPTSTTTTTTTTPSATSSSPPASSATSTTTPPAAGAHDDDHGEGGGIKSKTVSIIGGVVGGGLVLILIAVFAVLYIRRRNKRPPFPVRGPRQRKQQQQYPPGSGPNEKSAAASSFSSSSARARGFQISDPIIKQGSPFRTDFILKSPSASSSISNRPVNNRWSGTVMGPRNLTPARPARPPPQQQQQQQQQRQKQKQRHLSIPNPFNSPNPSRASTMRDSAASSMFDDAHAKTGHVVNGRLAPIRAMRASINRRIVSRRTEPQNARPETTWGERIDVFADENAVPPELQRRPHLLPHEHQQQHQEQQQQQQQQRSRDVHAARDQDQDRRTYMTTFSDLMEKADLGDVHRGKSFVPGTTPRL
ncbi:hypothetical protein IF1G_02055 [Cordyceps javanica]|uniref:Mid2 domain-containing protein n=1 Tax=Cordyceps javanica TaxID=43265 RepID=A0A545VDP0_9HYPO|nr:hypothetical protein IF1G_02055 [Cordyceps javanica]TQW10494.1 hypothetical protein IF2G_01436 [Cordyceps javanica]